MVYRICLNRQYYFPVLILGRLFDIEGKFTYWILVADFSQQVFALKAKSIDLDDFNHFDFVPEDSRRDPDSDADYEEPELHRPADSVNDDAKKLANIDAVMVYIGKIDEVFSDYSSTTNESTEPNSNNHNNAAVSKFTGPTAKSAGATFPSEGDQLLDPVRRCKSAPCEVSQHDVMHPSKSDSNILSKEFYKPTKPKPLGEPIPKSDSKKIEQRSPKSTNTKTKLHPEGMIQVEEWTAVSLGGPITLFHLKEEEYKGVERAILR